MKLDYAFGLHPLAVRAQSHQGQPQPMPMSAPSSRRRWLAVACGLGAVLTSGLALADEPRTLWIDVRTPGEYAQGYVPGARNIPVDVIEQHIARHAPDKNTPIALYCRSGNRSGRARAILQRMGYTRVSNEGAYTDLMRRGVRAD